MIAISRNRLQFHLRSTFTLTPIAISSSHSKMISNQSSSSLHRHCLSTCTRSFQQSQSTNSTKTQNKDGSHFNPNSSKNRMNNTKLNLKPAPIRPAAKSTSTSTFTSTNSSSDSSPTSSTKSDPDSISASMNKSVSTTTSQSSTSSPISTHTPTSTSPPSTSISTTEKSEDPTPPPSSPPQGQSLAEKAKSFIYTLRLFFRFYFRGVKQIWWDSRKISEIRKRSRLEMKQQGGKMSLEEGKREISDTENGNVEIIPSSRARGIKWSEAAMIRSHHHDLLCLPLFLILLVLLEEAIPLIVIFAPALLPTTCLLESQREGIRRREEVKRSLAWERLTGSNLDLQKEKEKIREEVKVKDWKLEGLSLENLRDFSHIFSLPSYGPSFLLRYRLRKRLEFLQKDDILLLEASKEPASSPDGMSTEREVLAKAAGERGLRASGISSTALRDSLFSYLTKISSGSSEDGIPSTLSLSIPISLYDTTELTSLRKLAQEQASRGVFAQAKDVMNSVLKEEKEREVREKEKKEAEEKENERKN